MHKNSRIIQAWQTRPFIYIIANGWTTIIMPPNFLHALIVRASVHILCC